MGLPREKEIKIEMRKASFGGNRSEAGRYAANIRWQGESVDSPSLVGYSEDMNELEKREARRIALGQWSAADNKLARKNIKYQMYEDIKFINQGKSGVFIPFLNNRDYLADTPEGRIVKPITVPESLEYEEEYDELHFKTQKQMKQFVAFLKTFDTGYKIFSDGILSPKKRMYEILHEYERLTGVEVRRRGTLNAIKERNWLWREKKHMENYTRQPKFRDK